MIPTQFSLASKPSPPPQSFGELRPVFIVNKDVGIACYKHYYGTCELDSEDITIFHKSRRTGITEASAGGGFFPPVGSVPSQDFFESMSYDPARYGNFYVSYEDIHAYLWFSMEAADVEGGDVPIDSEDFFGPASPITQEDFFQ